MKKIVIIGGGAGGAGAAAKLRRLDESSEIKIYESCSYASYSNCGLPYYFSGKIKTFEALILNPVSVLKANYNIDTFVNHQVLEIKNDDKKVVVKNLKTQEIFEDNYDELIIAPGVFANKPNIPGIDESNNIFVLKNPDDVKEFDAFVADNFEPKNVVVIGGGFIGLEIAENFIHRGVESVTIVDGADQLFATCDKDIAAFGHRLLIENNIKLKLNTKVKAFKNQGKEIELDNGEIIKSDVTFLTIGVETKTEMYENIGLKIGKTKGIIVDEKQRTNIENIYAVGDVAETFDLDKKPVRVALAAPASRQAVVAANTIYGIEDTYKGSQGTNAITLFDHSIASIGKTEKQLKADGVEYHKVISTKPQKLALLGGTYIWLKVLYDKSGHIFGAQAFGPSGAEKKISYMAIVMYAKQTIFDMVEYQVAYNPLIDVSFDAMNMAGRMARLELSKQVENVCFEELEQHFKDGWQIIDVRNPGELKNVGEFDNAINIPWSKLRENLDNLDKNGKYIMACRVGMRSYNATMLLKNSGFENVKNLMGSYDIWYTNKHFRDIK
ncbi:hypothetical protein SCHIN_v1c02120 [Spiroplasma chinense]|uniref:Rhodanese domain-containing protein n=1 Tax=Spiroplasma chinense TaxID=216932 RepID=A0A5B9Y405_9MOLU|nr:FAD-dependent oxidoreductase [Spiroplasma chinense]QEH61409.1 hypothetical protein SCHIN_v1c02120 [Spiroplasma chinense]